MTIKAVVTGDIRAYSLVSLRGMRDDDPNNIYIQANLKDYDPDLFATKDLKEGDEVTLNIQGSPVWKVRLSKDTRPGTLISADDNGEECTTNTRDFKRYIGYSIEGGKAGDVISYVRKRGVLDHALAGELEGLIDDEEV